MFDCEAAGCIEAMASAVRAESAAIAARLKAVARLYAQRCRDYEGRQHWAGDIFDAVAAEVSAAQNISRARAGVQVRMAVSLFDRLPRVAEVFAAGDIVRGASLVVWAIRDGRDAADSIHRYIQQGAEAPRALAS